MECQACREMMMDVLYGEAEAGTRHLVLEHHAACGECREEFEALGALRRDLAHWRLPDALRPRHRSAWLARLPYVVAAASLLLALTSVIVVSMHSSRAERSWNDALAREEARHAREIQGLRAALAAPLPTDAEHLLATMARMLRESETRQTAKVGEGLADLRQKTEAQRRYDRAQVRASLAYLEGKTGMQMARTTELMGHVLQASQER